MILAGAGEGDEDELDGGAESVSADEVDARWSGVNGATDEMVGEVPAEYEYDCECECELSLADEAEGLSVVMDNRWIERGREGLFVDELRRGGKYVMPCIENSCRARTHRANGSTRFHESRSGRR